jgi:hypothetical protein
MELVKNICRNFVDSLRGGEGRWWHRKASQTSMPQMGSIFFFSENMVAISLHGVVLT